MPLARKTVSHSGQPMLERSSEKPSTMTPPTRISKKSMKQPPRFCVKRNITYMMTRKIGRPSQRLSTTASILSVIVALASPLRTTAFSAIAETKE